MEKLDRAGIPARDMLPDGRGAITYVVSGHVTTTANVCHRAYGGYVFYKFLRDELALWCEWRELCAVSDVVSIVPIGSETESLSRDRYHVIRNAANPGEYWHAVTSRYGYWVATPGQVSLYARELYADGTWVQELPAGGEWVLWSDVVDGGE